MTTMESTLTTAPHEKTVRPPGPLVIEIEAVTKVYEMGSETIHALARGLPEHPAQRVPRHHGPERQRQKHHDEHARLPGYPDGG